MRATAAFAAALATALALPSPGLQAQEMHALLVVGIGGDETHRERFTEWGAQLHDALLELGLSEDRLVYLGERTERTEVMSILR